MTDTQLYLAIGLPIVAVIESMRINLFALSGFRDTLNNFRDDLKNVREDIREIRQDIKILTGKVY